MPSVTPRSRLALYLDLIRWDRPAGWLVCLWPTLSALWIAADGFPGWHLLVVSVKEALSLGAVLALVAFGLVLTTNKAAIAWSVPAVLVAIAYPFTKRIISMPQAVLGIAFNFGIVIAFAAVQGSVPAVAWWMWLGNLFWVLAYDTEYAMVDRDDDLKIGIKTSAITLGRWDVPAIVAFYLLFLSIWALALYPYALNAIFYIAIAVALAQVLWHFTLIRTRSREGCFKAFRVNHWLGATVFAGIAGSYLLRWLGLTG